MGKVKPRKTGAGVTTRHKVRGTGGFSKGGRSPTVSAPHKHKRNKIVRGKLNKRIKKPKRHSKRIRK